jgi:integrase
MATIVKRGNSYLIRVDTGRKARGKRPRKNFTWKPEPGRTDKQIEKDLTAYAAKLEDQARTGRVLDGNIKFETFAEKWLTLHAEKQLAPKTVYEYRKQLVRINQAIGQIRLDRLQPSNLIEFYDNLGENGIRDDIRYQAKSELAGILACKQISTSGLSRLAGLGCSTAQAAVKGQRISRKSA